MSTPVRLIAFLGLLAAVLLGGLGIGRAVGPLSPAQADAGHAAADAGHVEPGADLDPDPDPDADHADAGHGAERPTGITGLAVSQDGLTLRPETTTLPLGSTDFRFTVAGPDGPLTDYDPTHERDLHLVVVRRDTTGFQHLHPVQDDAGTWSTSLTLDRPGPYRVYADFAPAGEPARTLAVDVVVPGEYLPAPAAETTTTAPADGYDVALAGDLAEGTLTFTVTRDGRPVDDLEPYLGAGGHLVVLREGDLGYLHVHPVGEQASGPDVVFEAEAPSEGRYRLFLQFQHDGAVRTAAFAVDTGAAS